MLTFIAGVVTGLIGASAFFLFVVWLGSLCDPRSGAPFTPTQKKPPR